MNTNGNDGHMLTYITNVINVTQHISSHTINITNANYLDTTQYVVGNLLPNADN